jgi:hypothetical protein
MPALVSAGLLKTQSMRTEGLKVLGWKLADKPAINGGFAASGGIL